MLKGSLVRDSPEHLFGTLNKTPVILCLVLVQTKKTGKPDMTENIDWYVKHQQITKYIFSVH